MATETDKFLENYKRLENVLQETGQGSVLDFENAHQTEVDADQTADKVKIARLMRNYITHHADGKTFLTVTPAMNRFLTRLADREEAEIQHVKDIMVRQKPLTPDMALKDAVSALSKSKFHWAAVVDKKTKKLAGVLTDDDMISFIAKKGALTGKLSSVLDDAALKRSIKNHHVGMINPEMRASEVFVDGYDMIVVCDDENVYKGIVNHPAP